MRLWQKAATLTLGAASLAGGLAAPVMSAQPAYADWNQHDIVMGGDVLVFDDEVIRRRDKRCPHALDARGSAQLPNGPATVLLQDRNNKCGGEVRVEIDLTATLRGARQDDPAQWCVRGQARLYEGAKDTSGDLDGSRVIPEQCGAPGQTLVFGGTVHNDAEGGDYGDYNIQVALG